MRTFRFMRWSCLLIIIIGCGCKNSSETAVKFRQKLEISPEVKFDTHKINGHNLLHVTYSWTTDQNFSPPTRPLRVKAHFTDQNGDVYWQDDHQPSPEITEWEAGTSYKYKRVVYIPLIPRITEIKCLVGFFDPINPRMTYNINGELFRKDKYSVNSLTVSPPRRPEDLPGSKIKYGSGWYDLERNAVSKEQHRWMSGRAICELVNPKRDAELYCDCWIPTGQFEDASSVMITINDNPIIKTQKFSEEFTIYESIPSNIFGDKDVVKMEIVTDQTYVPMNEGMGEDTRELGIMFKTLYFN